MKYIKHPIFIGLLSLLGLIGCKAPEYSTLGELEIKSAEDEIYHRFALAELSGLGIEVNANAETSEWICEMRIPLGSAYTFQYALGRSEIESIKIEMKTPEMDFDVNVLYKTQV